MTKPTMLQSLLGRPSQSYSFPQEKVYYSTKQDMLRFAAETSQEAPSQAAPMHDDAKPNAIKPTNDVRALTDTTRLPITELDDDDYDDGDSDDDVFYTPNTSPRTSMASTIAAPLRAPSPLAVPSTKTSFTHVNTSTTSISSSALDAHSLFSIANSDSTLMTSTVQSDSAPPTNRLKTSRESPQVSNGHANQEWAKDVRWLVPSAAKATTTPRRRQSTKVEPQNKSVTRTKPNTPMSKTISKMTPSIMSSMTALLEEDELQDGHDVLHHPRSSVLISTSRRSGPRSRMSSNPNPISTPPTRAKVAPPNIIQRRRSRSLDHGSASQASSSSSHQTSTSSSHTHSSHRVSKYASSSADPYDRTSTSLPTFTLGDLPSHGTPGYTSLVLPRAPVPLSQTLHRPKGLFSQKDTHRGANIDGKVDLTRNGIAQTTMASVEVVRGLSGGSSSSTPNTSPSKKLMGLFRRGSAPSGPRPAFGTQSRSRGQSEDGLGKGQEVYSEAPDLPLGFTSYRTPPKSVSNGGVLVQVWAVGVDGLDWRLVFGGSSGSGGGPARSHTYMTQEPRTPPGTPPSTPKRSVSLRSTLGRFGGAQHRSGASSPGSPGTQSPSGASYTAAGVGYIPGRSFVGRVLECGWEVGEEVCKKGEWVVGLLDLKKCGALTEFIVVDRHRVHRAPYPRIQEDGLAALSLAPPITGPLSGQASSNTTPHDTPSPSNSSPSSSTLPSPSPSRSNSTRIPRPHLSPFSSVDHVGSQRHQATALSLEELALLPICGIPAYRAIRTFAFAFSDGSVGDSGDLSRQETLHGKGRAKEAYDGTRQRRVLVLRGHDGAGAIAVQMLVRRGWRVCVHVPFACLAYETSGLAEEVSDGNAAGRQLRDQYCMRRVEERVRAWGGEEVIFDDGEMGDGEDERGPVVRVIDRLCGDGDVFDAVLDTVGGKEVWEASERLLKSVGSDAPGIGSGSGSGKKEKSKKGGIGVRHFTTLVGDSPGRTIPSAGDNFKAGLRSLNFGGGGRADGKKLEGKVGYAWVSHAQDVDWEGENIRETLGAVLKTVIDGGIRPWVGENVVEDGRAKERVVPLEKAPGVFASSDTSMVTDGGTVVVKVVG
ncbi:hypothetical protein FPV67DRAFT_1469607 [Lyophyllum atratum]|nr:hypothetical protein FPV67DRAFT_1469607 [Lyophyllum atratum]